MYPKIKLIGEFGIASYGLMIIIGTTLAVLVLRFRKRTSKLPMNDIFYSGCFAGIGVAVGSKLLYALTMLSYAVENAALFTEKPFEYISVVFGGYVFYGGLLGGLTGAVIYCRIYKLSCFETLDVYAPVIPLIHSFGRIGCFLAGCCYGRPSERFGVLFDASPFAPHGIKLFPVQLLESGINLAVFLLLFAFSVKERKCGSVLGLYLCIYAVERFLLEYLRFDEVRGLFLGVSTSQWISLILLPIGLILLFSGKSSKIYKFLCAF